VKGPNPDDWPFLMLLAAATICFVALVVFS
jgi:hypothetical protein